MNDILKSTGFEEERVLLRWISASEGQRFADTIIEFTAKLKEMGPSPMRKEWAV